MIRKLKKKINRVGFKFLAIQYVSKGYTYKNIRVWLRKCRREVKKAGLFEKNKIKKIHKKGYTEKIVNNLGLSDQEMKQFISPRDYMYIMPINASYQKWLTNIITTFHVLKPFQNYFPEYLYHLTRRDGKRFVIPLKEGVIEYNFNELKKDLIESENLTVCKNNAKIKHRLTYKNGELYRNGIEYSFEELQDWIENSKKEYIIAKDIVEDLQTSNQMLLYVANENGNDPKILDAIYKKGEERVHLFSREYMGGEDFDWEKITECIKEIGMYLPQIEYMGVVLDIIGEQFYIKKLINRPSYFAYFKPSKELTAYLKRKLEEKKFVYANKKNIKTRGQGVVKRYVRKLFAKTFYPKGLRPYLSCTWIRDLWIDFSTQKEVPFGKKMYAYKNGFLSYRLEQYNITEDTRYKYISDFEYKWLRHINSKYRTWLEDKNTIKYIATNHKESFPDYYYYIGSRNGKVQIIGLQDCPKKGVFTYGDILELIQEKKCLALKPDEGSHGDGFYRCEYKEDKYYLNFKEAEVQDIIDILSNENNAYIVTEYINMHSDLKRIYSGSVNTLRAIVFKKDGRNPEIGNVYMRIGTSSTGAIDNMSAGGMFAAVNEVTGEYGNAKRFVDGNIVDCPIHPDTGVLIEGTLPNWDRTKQLILDIATELKQIEFFGFDLAITEDGIKIPEINRSPDYPKIEKYTDKTNEYLLYKLEQKKIRFNYDKKCNKLIHLPKR